MSYTSADRGTTCGFTYQTVTLSDTVEVKFGCASAGDGQIRYPRAMFCNESGSLRILPIDAVTSADYVDIYCTKGALIPLSFKKALSTGSDSVLNNKIIAIR